MRKDDPRGEVLRAVTPSTDPTTRHPGPWSPTQRGQAWAVHGFTALGIVAAMLALRDVLTDHPDYAILWLLLTLLIDGVDGPIARALRVSERVPRIDGYTLDLIIDYVAGVIAAEPVPQPNPRRRTTPRSSLTPTAVRILLDPHTGQQRSC